MIPKKKGKLSFEDYRPISLCNTLYKINSKIIAERIKNILAKHITREQAGFLKDRNIHEAVAITQEILHSMQTENLDGVVMKIDLNKAYDRVEWTFLRLILFKIGLDNGVYNSDFYGSIN